METLLAFCAFAFVASITPGPTNFLILSTSHQFSIKKTAGLIVGSSIGAALLVFIEGIGVGKLLNEHQNIQLILSFIGGLWLSYISWKICTHQPNIENDMQNKNRKSGFFTGFFLQFINPKSWLMAIAVITVYTTHAANYQQMLFNLSFLFMLISLPCLFTWAYLGKIMQKFISSSRQIILVNRILGFTLFLSVWFPILNSVSNIIQA